ncbi:DUF3667 domain-containing protein [Agrobacterium bohemicum]|uniref:DUF3667 domain-containing protein n=2 Tax=Agrobacterium bohemicum TaxID=2052828 RepID=A0A135P777_9HYPH|nr:DUF3667 domain-containing protein [Agrobacterium bohemicum]KXG87273.1 hypothetical protein ATO67_19890 [Agrobacterium bohemicum]
MEQSPETRSALGEKPTRNDISGASNRFFEEPICRNCGEPLRDKYCHVCGQKKAQRLNSSHLRDEVWEKLRWFEADMAKSAFRVVTKPGAVAREYVLGQRKSHTHPLKLLLAAIVVLLLVIAQVDYLGSQDERLSKAVALVQSWSKWSFSLGILAILVASNIAFWARQGFNFIEHLVLATYAHFVIIVANTINLSPLLLDSTAEIVKSHRFYTGYYMPFVEIGIVFFAFGQFFAIDWRQQWWWPAIGAGLFYLSKEGLFYLYARAVIRIVIAQLS